MLTIVANSDSPTATIPWQCDKMVFYSFMPRKEARADEIAWFDSCSVACSCSRHRLALHSRDALLLIQLPLKLCEHLADFVGLAEVGEGVRQ